MNERVFVAGLGAVSPAGWGLAALRAAVNSGTPLAVREWPSPPGLKPLRFRDIPTPDACPSFFTHPRLRRCSAITLASAGALIEALGSRRDAVTRGECRLGLIVCVECGCVQYTARFYEEVLQNPVTASPLLFPETVLNAPASHLAALLGGRVRALTVVGDSGAFLSSVATAGTWLLEGVVDECIVLGAEEPHPLPAQALAYFDSDSVLAGGAGAIRLSLQPSSGERVLLDCVTDAFTYSSRLSRQIAASQMRAQLPPGNPRTLLCDGRVGRRWQDAVEASAWSGWPGPVASPKRILGEGLMAGAAWQTALACDALSRGTLDAACVSVVGLNQQAIGSLFRREGH